MRDEINLKKKRKSRFVVKTLAVSVLKMASNLVEIILSLIIVAVDGCKDISERVSFNIEFILWTASQVIFERINCCYSITFKVLTQKENK